MLRLTHLLLGAICGAAILGFLIFGAAAQQLIDPEGDLPTRLSRYFLPYSARHDSYVGRGWHYKKLQFLCVPVFLVAVIIFAVTG